MKLVILTGMSGAGTVSYTHLTITGKEFMKIFRELKGLPDPDEEKKEEEDQKEENGNDV